MSATIALQSAILRRRRASFGVEDFLALALGVLLAIGLIGAYPRLAALIAPPVVATPAAGEEAVAADSETAAGAQVPEALTPRMRAALEYVSRRYRVSTAGVKPVFEAAEAAGRNLRLDPLLIIAVIGIESSFNPFSESIMGAQGLMQVIPRFHPEKLPEGAGSSALFDPVTNVQVGALVLKEAITRTGGLVTGLQQFAGAADDPEQRYANRVMAEKQRLESSLARR